MNNYLNLLLLFISLAGALALVLILLDYLKSKKRLDAFEDVSLSKTQSKSFGVLQKAIQKANTILGRAELEGVKVVADSRVEVSHLKQAYQQQFADQLKETTSQFEQFLTALKNKADTSVTDSQSFMQSRVNELLEGFESKLSDLLTQTQSKSFESIELEIKAARNLIDTYKQQQLNLIDENIVAMLEKTLSLVIAKKLTLRDQLDLVYEALEKAKVEKFII